MSLTFFCLFEVSYFISDVYGDISHSLIFTINVILVSWRLDETVASPQSSLLWISRNHPFKFEYDTINIDKGFFWDLWWKLTECDSEVNSQKVNRQILQMFNLWLNSSELFIYLFPHKVSAPHMKCQNRREWMNQTSKLELYTNLREVSRLLTMLKCLLNSV